ISQSPGSGFWSISSVTGLSSCRTLPPAIATEHSPSTATTLSMGAMVENRDALKVARTNDLVGAEAPALPTDSRSTACRNRQLTRCSPGSLRRATCSAVNSSLAFAIASSQTKSRLLSEAAWLGAQYAPYLGRVPICHLEFKTDRICLKSARRN